MLILFYLKKARQIKTIILPNKFIFNLKSFIINILLFSFLVDVILISNSENR